MGLRAWGCFLWRVVWVFSYSIVALLLLCLPLLLSRLGAGIRTAEERGRAGVLFFAKGTKELEGRCAFLVTQAVFTALLGELGCLAHQRGAKGEASGCESLPHTVRGE